MGVGFRERDVHVSAQFLRFHATFLQIFCINCKQNLYKTAPTIGNIGRKIVYYENKTKRGTREWVLISNKSLALPF